MAQSVRKIVWINLLSEIGFSVSVSTKLWCDNQVALHIASNLVFYERPKNIEVDCHFVRENTRRVSLHRRTIGRYSYKSCKWSKSKLFVQQVGHD